MIKTTFYKWLIPVLITAFIFILFKLVFLIGYVPTESMEPTIKKGSYIVGIRLFSELETGDIIIFRHDEKLLVKRIAAVDQTFREDKTKNEGAKQCQTTKITKKFHTSPPFYIKFRKCYHSF